MKALLVAITLSSTFAVSAAATATATAKPPASCTSGNTGWSVYHGKPGQASVWFASGTRGRSHPSECMQIRVRIVSEKDLRYYSGWIRAQTLNGKQLIATAKVGSAAAGDGTAVASAKEERQWSGGTHQMCRELAPDTPPQTKWVNCSF